MILLVLSSFNGQMVLLRYFYMNRKCIIYFISINILNLFLKYEKVTNKHIFVGQICIFYSCTGHYNKLSCILYLVLDKNPRHTSGDL